MDIQLSLSLITFLGNGRDNLQKKHGDFGLRLITLEIKIIFRREIKSFRE